MDYTVDIPQAAKNSLEKAKIALMSHKDSAFFTTVCFSLKHIWDSSISTACTDGKEIRFSPDFWQQQTHAQQVGLLLHETLHVALMHMLRRGNRCPKKWNVAADYVINGMLIERGFELPEGGLYDAKYLGWDTVSVYDDLEDSDVPVCPDMDITEPGNDDSTPEQIQQNVDDILVRASLQSQMQKDAEGSIPGESMFRIDQLTNPKLPWHHILLRFMSKFSKSDYSTRKPNRRFLPDFYLPTLYSEALTEIVVAVDASCSVTDDEFTQFITETDQIIRNEKPSKLTFIQFDTEIKSVSVLKSCRDLRNLEFKGRGGTCIAPVLEWAREHKPSVMVIFTDGEFSNDTPNPKVPIVWVIHDDPRWTAPYGKVIHYHM